MCDYRKTFNRNKRLRKSKDELIDEIESLYASLRKKQIIIDKYNKLVLSTVDSSLL